MASLGVSEASDVWLVAVKWPVVVHGWWWCMVDGGVWLVVWCEAGGGV